jgi:hypothetical protein
MTKLILSLCFLLAFTITVHAATTYKYYFLQQRVPEVGNKFYLSNEGVTATFCDDLNWDSGCIRIPKDINGKFSYKKDTTTRAYKFTPMQDSSLRLEP